MRNRPVCEVWLVGTLLALAALGLSSRSALAADPAAPDYSDFNPSLRPPADDALNFPGGPATRPALMDAAPPESVYGDQDTQPAAPEANTGGTHVQLDFDYYNHYVYRGVDHSLVGGRGDSANLESQALIGFDIGPVTPFVGVFSNVFDSDPISRFQEIRPFFGVNLNLRPLTLSAGDNAYLYPERRAYDTSEVWGKFQLDDGYIFGLDQPILDPYIYGAYDYDKNKGWYFEAGLKHDFAIEQTGVTLSPYADVGYIWNYQEQFVFVNNTHDTGFQHYDVGLIASFSLNTLLNVPERYGAFDLTSRLVDTGQIRGVLDANNVLWGGVGVEFRY